MTTHHDRPNGRCLRALAAFAVSTVMAPLSAHAAIADADPFAGLAPLPPAELRAARGGMMINGIPINFSVVVRSTVQGAQSQGLQTTLTVDDGGRLAGAETVPVGGGGDQALWRGQEGTAMTLPGGSIIHQVVNNHLRAHFANTADNVVLSHVTDINVDMPGFLPLTQSWLANRHVGRLGDDAAIRSLAR